MPETPQFNQSHNGPSAASAVAANPNWLRGIAAVAAYLGGVSVKTISSWITRGVLPFTRMPGSRLLLFRRADVDAALEKFRVEGSA